jgi:hypothetical protein
MIRSRKVMATAGLLLLLCLAGSELLLRQVDRMRASTTLEDVLYISSPKLLQRLSLGYSGLTADIYWTRVVQYYGAMHHVGGGRYELLLPLLNITTQLDPHLTTAYQFGQASEWCGRAGESHRVG